MLNESRAAAKGPNSVAMHHCSHAWYIIARMHGALFQVGRCTVWLHWRMWGPN